MLYTPTPTSELVKSLYKDQYGKPIELSPGQDELFAAIAQKRFNRLHVMHHTRYGKSMTVGLAALTRASIYPEKWSIIGGTKEKAGIIMDYVIQHIFDNDFTAKRFVPEKGESLEDIRRRRSKHRITFKVGTTIDENGKEVPLFSDVFIGTAKDALGFGAQNVIMDEAALIPDDQFSLVLRMLGDDVDNNFLCKIGNPFTRGHFLESLHNPKYKKLVVDCYRSLEEGRITQEIIDENKPYPFFKVLYECKFPSATEVDESGWLYLLTDKDVLTAQDRVLEPRGEGIIGHDVARGGRNYNVWVYRCDNHAKIIRKDHDASLVSTGDTTINLAREYGVRPENIYIDDGGVGGGEVDYLTSKGFDVTPVNLGERPKDEEDMLNVRAQVYAGKEGLMTWVKSGGALEKHIDWIQLTKIRYKKDSGGKTKLESKEDMRKRGVDSPDVADALALTFAKTGKNVYYGIDENNIKSILDAGAASPFGGVSTFPGLPG